MHVLFLFFLSIVISTSVDADRHAEPNANPHQKGSLDCTCPAQFLNPAQLHTTLKATQADTFISTEIAKVAQVPMVLYNFRQPARLNHQQLPFKIVLMNSIGQGALEIEVEDHVAKDSWFVGYQWSVLVCTTCQNNMAHIGWKFTSTDGTGDSFYALIVRVKEDNQGRAGMTAMEAFRDMLSIGQPATQWMTTAALGLLATMDTSKTGL